MRLVVVEKFCSVVVCIVFGFMVMLVIILVKICSVLVMVLIVLNSGFLFFWLFLLYVSGWFFISVRSVIRWLFMWLVLLCVSLGMFGFFFCGMIELLV